VQRDGKRTLGRLAGHYNVWWRGVQQRQAGLVLMRASAQPSLRRAAPRLQRATPSAEKSPWSLHQKPEPFCAQHGVGVPLPLAHVLWSTSIKQHQAVEEFVRQESSPALWRCRWSGDGYSRRRQARPTLNVCRHWRLSGRCPHPALHATMQRHARGRTGDVHVTASCCTPSGACKQAHVRLHRPRPRPTKLSHMYCVCMCVLYIRHQLVGATLCHDTTILLKRPDGAQIPCICRVQPPQHSVPAPSGTSLPPASALARHSSEEGEGVPEKCTWDTHIALVAHRKNVLSVLLFSSCQYKGK
jgi:hypothetical protein